MTTYTLRGLAIVIVIAPLLGACVSPGEGGNSDEPRASVPGHDGGWFLLDGSASPSGTVSAFHWVPPAGFSGRDQFSVYDLIFDMRPVLASSEETLLREWALFAFDPFPDGPNQGSLRPMYYGADVEGTHYQGLPVTTATPSKPSLEPEHVHLRNRTSFDGRDVYFVLFARADADVRFGIVLDPQEGVSFDNFSFEVGNTPDADTAYANATRRLAPMNTSYGFEIALFQQWSETGDWYAFQSPTMTVERPNPPGSSVGPVTLLRLNNTGHLDRGWTYATFTAGSVLRASSYTVDADYRGLQVHQQGQAVAGGPLRNVGPAHFVYRNGEGPNQFRMEIEAVDGPAFNDLTYFRLDAGTNLDELLGRPTFDWSVQKPKP